MGHILSKTVLNFKMSHIGKFLSYSGVLYCFRRKSSKTTVMWKKLGISEINSELTETTIFVNYVKQDKYCRKLFCTSK